MTILQVLVLALVQGITEFLPISSSGHLILVPSFTDWPDQGLAMDVAVHVGTLFAVMLYFWRDMWAMIRGLGRAASGRRDPGAKLAGLIILGTLPVVAAGWLVNTYVGDGLRSMAVIGWAMLGFGVLLWIADTLGMKIRRVEHFNVPDALIIGLAQCLALIPGTSRAGITMTAARVLGYEREAAARISLLLSIPTIIAAGVLKGKDLMESGDAALTTAALLGAFLAFLSALAAIWLMMAWLKRASFTPFVIYRVGLGAILIAIAYGWM